MAIDQSLLDEIQNDKENSGGSKTPTWKVPADGKEHTIRILPGFFGKTGKRWYEPLVQHWGPSPDGRGNNIAYPCLKEHFGKKKCPFCDAWEEARNEERSLDESAQHCSDDTERKRLESKLKKVKSLIKDLSFRRAYLHNVIDRSENTPITRAFFAPKTVWDVFVSAFTNNSDGDIFDPEEGHDFVIKRKTENNRTSYSASVKLKPSPVAEDQAEYKRLMTSRIDFPAEYLSTEPSVEDMQKTVDLLISGAGKRRTFQEEDVPRRRNGDDEDRPRRRRDDEDEPRRRDDEDEPRRRDDDERPRSRRDDDEDDFRPQRKPVVDEEEDLRPRRKPVIDEEEDLRPRRKPVIDEEEDLRPKRKPLIDDEDDFRPQRKPLVDDEGEKRPSSRRVSLDDDERPAKSAKDKLLSRFQEDDD